MNARTYSSLRLLTPDEALADAVLHVSDGLVVSVEHGVRELPEAIALDGTVVPGLVDLQVNGLDQRSVLEATPGAIADIATALLRHGVTAWLPTIVSASQEARLRALDAVASARESATPERSGGATGARVLGAHLEGPWISPVRAGAHDVTVLEPPGPEALERSLRRHPGLVKIVTLAPELPGGLEAVEQVVAAGAIASIGHTDATFGNAVDAIEAGVRMATHLFNAMRPIHQRDPGVIAAVLADHSVVAGLIADGIHVHPALVALAFRNKPGRIALVSDAVPGPQGGAARRDDGTLAGSLTALCDGVRVAATSGVTFRDAVTAATRTPSDLVGASYGRLEPGAPADFVVLDEDLRPKATYMSGELVWRL